MIWIRANATALQGLLGIVAAGAGVGLELGAGWGLTLMGLALVADVKLGRRKVPE